MRGLGKYFLVAAAALSLASCASDPSATSTAQNDPYENTNRAIFDFNNKLDNAIILPAAKGYVAVAPTDLRTVIHNLLTNLDLPITFANDILQGDMDHAGETLGRFTVNTTIGLGGMLDPATDVGIGYHDSDFGVTLGKWGVAEGPYLVVPFYGPDNPRDGTGQIVDIFLDPTFYVNFRSHFWYSAGREGLYVLDLRSRNIDNIDSLERSSIDYYASVRSLYRQHRNSLIHDGQPDVTNLPNL
jgi:phospholipid-binding lipoprotein MlaA